MHGEINKVKDYVKELNKSNSQKRDCVKDKREMNAIFEKFQREFLDLRDDHRGSKDRIKISEISLTEKAAKSAVVLMQEHLNELPTKAEVIALRNYMRTNIDKFREENQQFTLDFDAHLAIIARYDEILSEKASKHALYLQEVKMDKHYKPVIKKLDDRVLANKELIELQKDLFLKF